MVGDFSLVYLSKKNISVGGFEDSRILETLLIWMKMKK